MSDVSGHCCASGHRQHDIACQMRLLCSVDIVFKSLTISIEPYTNVKRLHL
ncbi:hypothetical protein [Ruminococcus sp. XPD3002]|uniref:hypothetical protein n=1 Tax=Ruminococcus sp. XPD3002 TaxID=1452269 RepID=UPI0015873BDC